MNWQQNPEYNSKKEKSGSTTKTVPLFCPRPIINHPRVGLGAERIGVGIRWDRLSRLKQAGSLPHLSTGRQGSGMFSNTPLCSHSLQAMVDACPGGWITSTPRCTIFGIYPNPDARVGIRFPFLETLAQNTSWPPRTWSVWSGRRSWAKSPFELMWPSRNAITTNAPPFFSMVSCRVASFSLISGMKSRE